ncbi:MAG: hypothetical protein H6605_03655 [Flavobacteriales bacterium]|nr:hypothetical protein [Flavobacteriales bacterium]
MAIRLFTILLFISLSFNSLAQKNTGSKDSVRRLNPAKAALYSAILPGAGQIYNGKAWKSVIIYAGFAGITSAFIFNQREFKSYQHAVDVRYDTLASTVDTKYPSLTDGTVVSLRDYHRRNRDISILAFAAFYALNIIDANVDAHLQEFSINKDLSMRWRPTISFPGMRNSASGIHLTFTF